MSPPARASQRGGELSVQTLRKEISDGRLRSAYLLGGSEALLRDDALAALREAALEGGAGDFNFDRLDGESAKPADLIDAVHSLPVMAPRRLVWLREPEGKRGKGLGDTLVDLLPALAEREDVVLVVTASQLDRRSRWVKAFKDPAVLVDCQPPPAGKGLVAWIREEAKSQGVSLDGDAAQALAEVTGPQLLLLRHEVEKAALYAGPGEKVTRSHVLGTASDVAEDPIWDLTDAIGEGRTADAMVVLHRLGGAGAPPPVLLASLAGHFRKLVRARAGEAPRGHPFAVKKIQRQASRYTAPRLRACLDAIHDVDEILKGQGNLDPTLAMQRLVLGLSA
ncbi:MAG: DNA polymerase III subunit delta [bacterium]|nr:DNA polymerase III subunit delta [bacterium]